MPSPPDETWLQITGVPIPPRSSYQIDQTYEYIEAAKNNERDLNGNAVSLARPELMKYSTTIVCHDTMFPIGMDGIFPGQHIQITCVAPMVYPLGGAPARPSSGQTWPSMDGQSIAYLPVLDCLLDDFTSNYDEWGARVGWTLKASET